MPREQYQARLNDDLAEKVDEYREEHDMTKSDAVRTLLRAGIASETDAEKFKVHPDTPITLTDGGEIEAQIGRTEQRIGKTEQRLEELETAEQTNRLLATLTVVGMLFLIAEATVTLPLEVVVVVGLVLMLGLATTWGYTLRHEQTN